MLSVFYQSKPQEGTPYRTLNLRRDSEKGWCVRLTGGTLFEPGGDSELLKEELVKDFNAGKVVYDELFTELTEAGWRVYTLQEDWEPAHIATFQTGVNRELPKPSKTRIL
jgi:hypothetical protein